MLVRGQFFMSELPGRLESTRPLQSLVCTRGSCDLTHGLLPLTVGSFGRIASPCGVDGNIAAAFCYWLYPTLYQGGARLLYVLCVACCHAVYRGGASGVNARVQTHFCCLIVSLVCWRCGGIRPKTRFGSVVCRRGRRVWGRYCLLWYSVE